MVSGVAERYAKALLDLAEEAGAVDAVGADLDRFSGLIAESPDLARLVKSPVFSAEEQEKAVTAILAKAGIGGLTANFIRLVASKRRLFALPGMIEAYRSLVADKKGIVRAEVTLAEQPSPKMLADIEAALKDVAGGNIALNVKVNPAIIGGLIVKLGSRMIDASLRSKLNSIRLALKEVG
ncbi:F0F1 ATP synthase subunit delta [Chelatococcus sp. YT9]|uniref:F0F1 ATP synthase subunit delta n=1 Tax=Chelatococcus sp. YT9 TaxID=2835635 RepID=UPI0020C10EC0|nr:F0F1 ATP synthase subunit delta [Chelatococcus sp. YT9]